MTIQHGLLEGKWKEISELQQDLQESLNFVKEMKAAILEDFKKSETNLSLNESRKKDLEKTLQKLLEQEDKAGTLFIPNEYNENRKEQDFIREELQLVLEQQKRKQEILEQKKQKTAKIDQLFRCLKSIDLFIYQMNMEWDWKGKEMGEEGIRKDALEEISGKNGVEDSILREKHSEENVLIESIIGGRNFEKIAVGVESGQNHNLKEKEAEKETEETEEIEEIERKNETEQRIEAEEKIDTVKKAGYEEKKVEIAFDAVAFQDGTEIGDKNSKGISKRESAALLSIQEYERKRIAREMHDSTIQDMTTMIHRIEFVEKLIDMDVIRAKMELSTLKEMVKKSVNEMRNIIYDLHPVQIEEFGLKSILQKFVARISKEYKISINLLAEEDRCKDCTVNLALYRIIQEACNNSIRYSEATQIIIELKYMENHIQLVIEDNGLGFDVEEVQKKAMSEGRGFGLSVMKERVYLLSGKFEISSASGAGTKITVIVPRLV